MRKTNPRQIAPANFHGINQCKHLRRCTKNVIFNINKKKFHVLFFNRRYINVSTQFYLQGKNNLMILAFVFCVCNI